MEFFLKPVDFSLWGKIVQPVIYLLHYFSIFSPLYVLSDLLDDVFLKVFVVVGGPKKNMYEIFFLLNKTFRFCR